MIFDKNTRLAVMVFNDRAWADFGRDINHNECFFQPVTVKRAYVDEEHYILLDVRFAGSSVISKGHFADCIKIKHL